ncbi:unnamed protein product [Thelazia callipaeda]|uniref:HORMA domain-containing protein n=1 Tax=Thelazia callipaeda TaxID=103827 RepID=A0A0N5CJZ2_THECL|nr:unnamed protein product [Thelazia callipaeda]
MESKLGRSKTAKKDTDMRRIVVQQVMQESPNIPNQEHFTGDKKDKQSTATLHDTGESACASQFWEYSEINLTKKCINEVLHTFFSSLRNDVELVIKLRIHDIYPRLHIELNPIDETIQYEGSRHTQSSEVSIGKKQKHGQFDDLLSANNFDYEHDDPTMRSMEERSCSMCCAKVSDATTARSPGSLQHNTVYSHVVAFVKSIVRGRRRKRNEQEKKY